MNESRSRNVLSIFIITCGFLMLASGFTKERKGEGEGEREAGLRERERDRESEESFTDSRKFRKFAREAGVSGERKRNLKREHRPR